MDIMVAEYAVGAGISGNILLEGRAMLDVLVSSFVAAGHNVLYPTSGPVLSWGRPVRTQDFYETVETLSKQCDAALVVAPDELLGDLTELVEENTVNLGCAPGAVRLCADKLACTKELMNGGIMCPATATANDTDVFLPGQKVVIKPRWGCASEDTSLVIYSKDTVIPEGFVATEYIEGDHLSASLVAGERMLPLTVNRQNIRINGAIQYDGGIVGIDSGNNPRIFEVACRSAELLGCRGYIGIDIVMAQQPYVVDVNPRPTTSILGLQKVMDNNLGDLILGASFGGLPDTVRIKGSYSFTKADIAS